MKKQNTQSKVIVALTAVVLLLVALSATLTFAYFTATSNASSTAMQFGTLSVNVTNFKADQESGTCSLHKLVPGCIIDVGGNVDVNGNVPAFARIKLTATVYLIDENGTGFTVTGSEIAETGEGVEPTFKGTKYESGVGSPNAADKILGLANAATAAGWVANGGYFYSNTAIDPADTNTNGVKAFALKFVTPAAELGNDWQGAYVQFKVVAEAIQAQHLSTTYTEINGTTVVNLAAENAWATVANNGVATQQQQNS